MTGKKLFLRNIQPNCQIHYKTTFSTFSIPQNSQISSKEPKINLKINNLLSVKREVKLGQKIPPIGWVYGWVNRNLGEDQKRGMLG